MRYTTRQKGGEKKGIEEQKRRKKKMKTANCLGSKLEQPELRSYSARNPTPVIHHPLSFSS